VFRLWCFRNSTSGSELDHSRTRTPSNQNARAYEALVSNKPIVPLDENISRQAGVIEGQHVASDTKPTLEFADSVVAATGLVCNEAVVTDDTSDFETVEGLNVVCTEASSEA